MQPIESNAHPPILRTRHVFRTLAAALLLSMCGCEHIAEPLVRAKLALPARQADAEEAYADKTCEELYAETYRLFPNTYSATARNFYDDDRNAGFAFSGLIFEPLFLGLAYNGLTNFAADQVQQTAALELDLLRRAAAAKSCWQR